MEIEEAVSALRKELTPLRRSKSVSLIESTGRILGGDVTAGISVPSFSKSAMDGYAVRSSDIKNASSETPVKLKVIGCIYAGDAIPESLKKEDSYEDCAVRIMTGAAVPDGFDTVIKQEDTDYGEEKVKIYKAQPPYVNYCKEGEDIKKGSLVLTKGTLIGRAEAGVLASLGISEVNVLKKIRVTVISTGSEITDVGRKLPDNGIYNNVTYMIRASLNQTAFEVDSCTVPDDIDVITDALTCALKDSDIVITTGGVSVGVKDLVPEALDRIGAKKIFSGVNVKPGSPTTGAVSDGKALLCLSGNPYAAIANFDLYIGHIIDALTDCADYVPVRSKAVLMSDYDKPSNIRRLVRAKLQSDGVTVLTMNQASSVVSSFLGADCYIDLPKGSSYSKGDLVDVISIPGVML